jgi:YD repeat-containing protein
MTIFEFLNIKPNQCLTFSDEKFYAYGNILLNLESGELITLNNNQTLATQLKVTDFPFTINDKNGNQLYSEDSSTYWFLNQYNDHGKLIYYTNSNKEWEKREYNANGNPIRYEDSTGFWNTRKYNAKGKEIKYENSDGFWTKYEYDNNGKQTKVETSNGLIKHY